MQYQYIYNIFVQVLHAHVNSDVKKAITHTNTIPFGKRASPIQGVRSLNTNEYSQGIYSLAGLVNRRKDGNKSLYKIAEGISLLICLQLTRSIDRRAQSIEGHLMWHWLGSLWLVLGSEIGDLARRWWRGISEFWLIAAYLVRFELIQEICCCLSYHLQIFPFWSKSSTSR